MWQSRNHGPVAHLTLTMEIVFQYWDGKKGGVWCAEVLLSQLP